MARLRVLAADWVGWLATGCAIVLAVAMRNLVMHRQLDTLAAGTAHGAIGVDFFAIPRGWLLFREGKSIFDTDASHYGPYATWYISHPLLPIVVGPLYAWMPEVKALSVGIAATSALVALAAVVLQAGLRHPAARLAAPFVLFCSVPTYLLVWNAQAYAFAVVGTALVLAGLAREGRGEPGKKAVAAGLLCSLFSKPILLFAVPPLLSVRSLRRPVAIALGLYAAVSLAFICVPALNPGQGNLRHWLLPLKNAGTIERDNFQLFGLANLLHDASGATFPLWPLKLPVLAVVVAAVLNALRADEHDQAMNALPLTVAGVASYYLAYTMVWEYHFTTLLPALPALLDRALDARREERWIALVTLALGALLLVPTPYVLFRTDPRAHLILIRSPRVLSALAMFAGPLAMLTFGRRP